MNRDEVLTALGRVREAKAKWATAQAKFTSDVDAVMMRLLHEAAAHMMSAEQVAQRSGLTVKRVRMLMRINGLNPKMGKRLLAKHAAEALETNAALLGIEPRDFDLLSPLAYLPAGPAVRSFPETEASRGVKYDPVGLVMGLLQSDRRWWDCFADAEPSETDTREMAEKIVQSIISGDPE